MNFTRFCEEVVDDLCYALLEQLDIQRGMPATDDMYDLSRTRWWLCYYGIFGWSMDVEAAQAYICQTLFDSVTGDDLTEDNKKILTRVVNKVYIKFILEWSLYRNTHHRAEVNLKKPYDIILEPLCKDFGKEELWECLCDEEEPCGSAASVVVI